MTPQATAIEFQGRTLCFAELGDRVGAVVQALADLGVERGDVIAVHLPNELSIVDLVHAGFAGDFVVLLVNTRLRAREIESQLRDSGARFFLHPEHDAEAESVRLDPGVCRIHVSEVQGQSQFVSQHQVTQRYSGANSQGHYEELDPDSPRFILYTSGTAGRPKGVVLSAANLFASARGSAAMLGGGSADRWLLCLPVFHVGGLSILLRSVLAGSSVVLHRRFSPAEVNRDLDTKGVTGISLVANMLQRVIDERTNQAPPPSLVCVLLGGGPAPDALLTSASDIGFPVALTYGLTEAASQVATRLPDEPKAAGLRPLEGMQVKVVDESDRNLPPGHPGEICVLGASVTSGYWRRPEENREVFRGGWLHTGDIGSLDADGRLTVYHRRSDIIVSGGENIYPAEVEAVLLEHQSIAEASVVAVADETYGARPVAWLVANCEGETPDAQSLREHCRARLAGYKCPVEFYWTKTLPRIATDQTWKSTR